MTTQQVVDFYCYQAARFRLAAFSLIEEGRAYEAEGALAYARICERAAEAEDTDPDAMDRPPCDCTRCLDWYGAVEQARALERMWRFISREAQP